MPSNVTNFGKWASVESGIKINIDLSRFDKQYQRAQYGLDGDVMNSMIPFMPMQQGTFVQVTQAASIAVQGTGKVYAAFGPSGQFLYKGKTMVSEVTGSPWAKLGERKVLVSQYGGQTKSREDLVYNKTAHPEAQAYWFDAAKIRDVKVWVKNAKKNAGGGTRG